MKNYNYQGESFLNRLYKDLHMSDEVMHTADSSNTKDENVRKYLERLEKVEELAKNNKHNGIELLKELYYKKYVIKPKNVPESYFKMQKKIALERGYGHLDYTDDVKTREIEVIVNDQKRSLAVWLDYLMSSDVVYPEWFKYYAFQGMLKLGSYDKEKESFNKRTDSTTSIFVDLDREALALVYDYLCNVLNGQKVDDEVLQKLLEGGSFSKLYAYMLKKIDSGKKDLTDSNDGIWVKYNQGSKPDELVKSLEGKGTGWCTAGIETARAQLQGGNFYVYYTKDSSGEYKQPRIAIRMDGSFIGEIRGINEHQNLEPEMERILEKKLEEFPDKDRYKKKVSNMEKLTVLYNEYKNRELTIDELRFLYEIDNNIEGFGYQKDPRINEMLKGRNFKKDLSKVFNCNEDEISNNETDILNGKSIVYFYDSLYLGHLTTAEGLVLPNYIRGNLSLLSLTTIEGLTLPNYIGGDLNLRSLINVEKLILPNYIGGDLNLRSLTSVEKLTLPNYIGGNLYLRSLKKTERLTLPNYIGGDLNLRSLTSVEKLIFPNHIGGDLNLLNLKSVQGLVVPKNFYCYYLMANYITMDDLIAKSLENSEEKGKQKGFSKIGLLVILNLIISIGLIFFGVLFSL